MKKFIIIISTLLLSLTLSCIVNATELSFEDVSTDDWFYDDVLATCNMGLMSGRSEFVFAPCAVMTRAEFVILASRIAAVDTYGMDGVAADKFADIDSDDWYASYIGWASEQSLVNGYDDNTFRPNAPISRQELAVLLIRFLSHQKIELTGDASIVDSFADDADFPRWSAPYIEQLRLTGIVGGDENGCFNPNKSATRAEVSTITRRLVTFCNAFRDNIISSIGTLSLYVSQDEMLTEENLNFWLATSADPDSRFEKIFALTADSFIDSACSVLPGSTQTIPLRVEFSFGIYRREAELSVGFTRTETPVVNG